LKIGEGELPIFGTKDWQLGGMEISEVRKFFAEYRDQIKLVLTHNPDWVQKSSNDFDDSLILAGHTHGSQFSNWLISKLALAQAKYKSKLTSGRYKVRDSVELMISNGAGGSLPFRDEARRPDYLITELLRAEN
jgi:predicted MPP superfamily phosphohydrolase